MSSATKRSEPFSIVNYFPGFTRDRCGYCKRADTNAFHAMWAEALTVQDYQDLIDRGWRRSGKYCYKPIMDITCCPMYTIRNEALELKLSKSQKRTIKRLNRYLTDGFKDKDSSSLGSTHESKSGDAMLHEQFHSNYKFGENNAIDTSKMLVDQLDRKASVVDASINTLPSRSGSVSDRSQSANDGKRDSQSTASLQLEKMQQSYEDLKTAYRAGEGADPTKPPCKKAKLLRLERKINKLEAAGLSADTLKKPNHVVEKTLEQFLSEIPENALHKLKINLVRTKPPSRECSQTFARTYELYVKYQMKIHGKTRDKCTEMQFRRFLVDSPLELVLTRMDLSKPTFTLEHKLFEKYQMIVHKEAEEDCDVNSFLGFLVDTPLKECYTTDGPAHGYGSFHQQYWLDDNLIAVGVIDILPYCVSSVYFFYDPDYSFLSLGTYGSLRELEFTRELYKITPQLKYYYMGFYIHTCPKMRYKANLTPSYLLCPETYSWHPAEKCIPILDIKPYARFNEDMNATDANACVDVSNVLIVYNMTAYRYYVLKRQKNLQYDDELLEYANSVGKKCAERMFMIKEKKKEVDNNVVAVESGSD